MSISVANWWLVHGTEAPHLKAMSIKILKLTSSSSGCERNWSCFEGVYFIYLCVFMYYLSLVYMFVSNLTFLTESHQEKE